MKKTMRKAIFLLLVSSMLFTCGCGGKLAFDDMIEKYEVPLAGCSVTIHYRDEISGGVDVYTTLEGERAQSFIAALSYCDPIKEPKENYSVHLNAACQIVLSAAEEEKLVLYYDKENDWLITEAAQQKGDNLLMRYHFYRPDPVVYALLDIAAQEKQYSEQGEELQTSSLVLRAGISTDMLAASGTVVDYELYTGSYAHTDTENPLYRIYTAMDMPDVVQDSTGLIVASLGPCPTTGYAINISQIDYTDHLIRVFVHTESPPYPDDEETVETYPYVMATVDLDDFPLGLTVVFVDQNYTILDVQTLQMP